MLMTISTAAGPQTVPGPTCTPTAPVPGYGPKTPSPTHVHRSHPPKSPTPAPSECAPGYGDCASPTPTECAPGSPDCTPPESPSPTPSECVPGGYVACTPSPTPTHHSPHPTHTHTPPSLPRTGPAQDAMMLGGGGLGIALIGTVLLVLARRLRTSRG